MELMRNGSFSMRRGSALRLDRLCVFAAAALIAAACGPDDTPPSVGMGGYPTGGSGGTAGSEGGSGGTGGDGGTGGTGGDLLEIKSVEVTPTTGEMIPGETLQLAATVFDFKDKVLDAPVHWSSSDPEVAAVDETGLVTSVSQGEVDIVATAQNVEGKARITVLPTPVDSVTIVADDGDTRALRVGATLQLRAIARDVDGNEMEGLAVQWRTSDPVVATVDKQGLLTARGPGNGVSIDAHVGGVKATAKFNATIRFGEVVTGLSHSCGITAETGLPFCWGDKVSFFGAAESYIPRAVPGAPALTRLYVGTTHTCGLTAEGAAWCWGKNTSGRLGNKTGKDPETAVEVFGGHRFSDLALGAFHTCGIAEGGNVLCWGDNERGQLAKLRQDYGGVNEPIPSVTGPFEKLVAGNYYTCGLKADSSLWCWGTMAEGQTFLPATVANATPVRIGGPAATWDDVVAGSDFACVQRLEEKTVLGEDDEPTVVEEMVSRCWGLSGYSRLGDGSPPRGAGGEPTPVTVLAPEPLVRLAAGITHACGLSAEGVAYCWGANWGAFGKTGQLGIGADDAEYKAVPTTVETPTRFSSIDAAEHTCAIALDGITWCWGPNLSLQLGVQKGEPPMSPRPTRVFGQ